jgi:hypothetical protein
MNVVIVVVIILHVQVVQIPMPVTIIQKPQNPVMTVVIVARCAGMAPMNVMLETVRISRVQLTLDLVTRVMEV